MPRQARLGKKNGHWYMKAGNPNGVHFGKVGEVAFHDAKLLFADHLKQLAPRAAQKANTFAPLLTAELVDLFLDWVEAHRSPRTYDERKRHLQRFIDHRRTDRVVGAIPALNVQAADLSSFLAEARELYKLDPFTTDKYATSVKAAFNWGCHHPSPVTHVPPGFRPFASIEKYKRSPEPLLEDELPTLDEVELLLRWADAEFGTDAVIREGAWDARPTLAHETTGRIPPERAEPIRRIRGYAARLLAYRGADGRAGGLQAWLMGRTAIRAYNLK